MARLPGEAPGADMNALIKRVDELSQKTLNKGFTSTLQRWKRWVEGVGEYDVTGLRDVVKQNAIELNSVANSNNQAHQEINDLEQRVAVLEAQPPSGGTFP